MADLGTLSGTHGVVVAIDGNVAVGWSRTASDSLRATVWTIRCTTAPALRFGTVRYAAQESGRRATVTVVRTGRTVPAVSVRYQTSNAGAIAGRDFRAVSGTLRFASGQTRRSFSVPVLDDSHRERDEVILLTPAYPSPGAVLGTPNAAALVIMGCDQRPDAWVSMSWGSFYTGDNAFNGTGARQTKTLPARRARHAASSCASATTATRKHLHTARECSPARIHGPLPELGPGRDPLDALSRGWSVRVKPGLTLQLEVRITSTRSAAVGSMEPAAVTATWRGDGIRQPRCPRCRPGRGSACGKPLTSASV